MRRILSVLAPLLSAILLIAAVPKAGDAPGASSLGGVESASAPSNEFMTGISTGGAPTFAQPSFANLSATISAAGWRCCTSATLCPAHCDSASISPVVPTIGGAGS